MTALARQASNPFQWDTAAVTIGHTVRLRNDFDGNVRGGEARKFSEDRELTDQSIDINTLSALGKEYGDLRRRKRQSEAEPTEYNGPQ